MSNIWYGSIINRIDERVLPQKLEVGMGVTECGYTDRHPYEIVEVINEKHIVVRPMDYKRTDNNGMSESQEYEYTSNPSKPLTHLVLRNGRWRNLLWETVYEDDENGDIVCLATGKRCKIVGKKLGRKLGVDGWRVGKMEAYYDYSF